VNTDPLLTPWAKVISKMDQRAGQQWLTSVILATQQTEVKRIAVQSQLGQILVK
jgi:hypothetical protein